MTVAEMFVLFGLEVDRSSWAQGFAAITALKSAVSSVIGVIQSAAETGTKISKLSQQLGISNQQVQEWGYVAVQSGSSLQALSQGIRMLERNMFAVANGSTNKQFVAALGKVGITSTDTAAALKSSDGMNEMLFKLGDAFKKMGDTPERAAIATKLFGARASEAVADLQKGGPALREMIQHFKDIGGELSDLDIANLKALNNAAQDVQFSLRGIANAAIAAVAPAVTKALRSLTDWISAHRELIQTVLKRVVDVLVRSFQFLAKLVEATAATVKIVIDTVLAAVSALDGALPGAGDTLIAIAAAVGLAWLAASAPLVFMGVIIAALILIFQDLWVGLHGGRSIVIDFFTALSQWAEHSNSVLGETINVVLKLLGFIGKAVKGLQAITQWKDHQAGVENEEERADNIKAYGSQYIDAKSARDALKASGQTKDAAGHDLAYYDGVMKRALGATSTESASHLGELVDSEKYFSPNDTKNVPAVGAGSATGADPWAAGPSVTVHELNVHPPAGGDPKAYGQAVVEALAHTAKSLAATAVPGGKVRPKK